jgi:hypothetical protein
MLWKDCRTSTASIGKYYMVQLGRLSTKAERLDGAMQVLGRGCPAFVGALGRSRRPAHPSMSYVRSYVEDKDYTFTRQGKYRLKTLKH